MICKIIDPITATKCDKPAKLRCILNGIHTMCDDCFNLWISLTKQLKEQK